MKKGKMIRWSRGNSQVSLYAEVMVFGHWEGVRWVPAHYESRGFLYYTKQQAVRKLRAEGIECARRFANC